MPHYHCIVCNGMTDEPFFYCWRDCPSNESYLKGTVHSVVSTPGALEPKGVCGECGFPHQNQTFRVFEVFECRNVKCHKRQEYADGVIVFKATLPGRNRLRESMPCCPGCNIPLEYVRTVKEVPSVAKEKIQYRLIMA